MAQPPRLDAGAGAPASPGEEAAAKKAGGVGKVLKGLTRGRSSSDVSQLKRVSTSGEPKTPPAARPTSMSKSSDKEDLAGAGLAADLAAKRASLKRLFDMCKAHEKACEVLMLAIIYKEKGVEKVPHDREKLGTLGS